MWLIWYIFLSFQIHSFQFGTLKRCNPPKVRLPRLCWKETFVRCFYRRCLLDRSIVVGLLLVRDLSFDVGRHLKRRPWMLTAEDWANCPCHHWHIFIHAQSLNWWWEKSKKAQMVKHYSKSNVARILPGLECFYTEGDAGPWVPAESLIGFCVRPH